MQSPSLDEGPVQGSVPAAASPAADVRAFVPCSPGSHRRTIVPMRENPLVPKTEILNAEQCWKLLAETSIGRLAVTADGAPDLFPVNYKVDGESLLFRTGGGGKVAAIENDARIAVEADFVNEDSGRAWSVVIRGRAEITTSPDPSLETVGRGLFPWQGIGKDHLVRILPEEVTGRRFTLDPSTTWKVPLDEATRAGLE